MSNSAHPISCSSQHEVLSFGVGQFLIIEPLRKPGNT